MGGGCHSQENHQHWACTQPLGTQAALQPAPSKSAPSKLGLEKRHWGLVIWGRIWGGGIDGRSDACTAPCRPQSMQGRRTCNPAVQPASTLSAEGDFCLNLQLEHWETLCCPSSRQREWLLSLLLCCRCFTSLLAASQLRAPCQTEGRTHGTCAVPLPAAWQASRRLATALWKNTRALTAAAHLLTASTASKHRLGRDLAGSNQCRNERDAGVGKMVSSAIAESQLK